MFGCKPTEIHVGNDDLIEWLKSQPPGSRITKVDRRVEVGPPAPPKRPLEPASTQSIWGAIKWLVGMAVLLYVIYDSLSNLGPSFGGGCPEDDRDCEEAMHDHRTYLR